MNMNSGSIGIIGGADGPTAIIVSGPSIWPAVCLTIAALAALGLAWYARRRAKGRRKGP